MNFIIVVVLSLVAVAVAHPSSYYDTSIDNFDVTSITGNTRVLKTYLQCFLGEGKCTPEGNDVKQLIPEASKSSCAKCTEKQKKFIAACIRAMMDKLPEEWSRLSKQTDPEEKYHKELNAFLDQYAPA